MLFSMSEQELCSRADSAALPMTKKLSKRTAGKQAAEQPVKDDNQPSVQSLTSFKTSKQLVQFFAGESGKTPGSSKIKLGALMFKPGPGLLSNESVHEADLDDKNKDEISDEIEEVLKIIKKQVKSSVKKSVKSCKDSADDSSSSDSSSSSDESDH